MTVSIILWLNTVVVVVFTLAVQQVNAQLCYYPNGNVAPTTEKPCSTADGSACCPDNWICLDNGLCHYPVHNLYERYSCTDKTWNSPGCPSNLCTYGGQASGAESITQCSNHDQDWCCNADAQHVNCCQESPVARPFFMLKDGQSYATIGIDQASHVPTLSTVTGIATSAGIGERPGTSRLASSGQPSTSSRPMSGSSSATNMTPTQVRSGTTSIRSGSIGVQTVVVVSISTPSSETTSNQMPSNGSSGLPKTGLIVGCVVGILVGLTMMGILTCILHKHRQKRAHPYKKTAESASNGTSAIGVQKEERNSHFIAELEGRPFSSSRPVATVKCLLELESGTQFRPGAPASYGTSTVGIGGGIVSDQSMWGNAPPRYSPGADLSAYKCHNPSTAELDGTSATPYLNQKVES